MIPAAAPSRVHWLSALAVGCCAIFAPAGAVAAPVEERFDAAAVRLVRAESDVGVREISHLSLIHI